MKAREVKVFLGPRNEALQVGLINGTDGILERMCQSPYSLTTELIISMVDVQYRHSRMKLAVVVNAYTVRRLVSQGGLTEQSYLVK